MARLVFNSGDQKKFLLEVKELLGANNRELGEMVGISKDSMWGWVSEKTCGEKNSLEYLSEITQLKLPRVRNIKEEYWTGNWYGYKGGTRSQVNRREDPEKYRKLGCIVANKFKRPNTSDVGFAEFVGIVLGDGCITKSQIQITLNSEADEEYIGYVQSLIKRLFSYKPSLYMRKNAKAVVIVITGVDLVRFLQGKGLKIGNKVRLQVDVPNWIKRNKELSRWCIRGLIDTDGGIFTHRYVVGGKRYEYLKLQFCNKSKPLRQFVYNILRLYGFKPKHINDKRVWLYSQDETIKYLRVIGSSNYRLNRKVE